MRLSAGAFSMSRSPHRDLRNCLKLTLTPRRQIFKSNALLASVSSLSLQLLSQKFWRDLQSGNAGGKCFPQMITKFPPIEMIMRAVLHWQLSIPLQHCSELFRATLCCSPFNAQNSLVTFHCLPMTASLCQIDLVSIPLLSDTRCVYFAVWTSQFVLLSLYFPICRQSLFPMEMSNGKLR